MKKILGLDVGTNSVGWAFVDHDFETKQGKIIAMGSRILPMSQDMISDFNKGKLASSASNRTAHRGVRRLRERSLNRRKRLVTTLKHLGFIEDTFYINHNHSFAYELKDENRSEFKFSSSFLEMKKLFQAKWPELKNVPHDWTIYYLRKKALKERIDKEELAWLILQFNTKRGYFQIRGDESLETDTKKSFVSDIVDNITELEEKLRGKNVFTVETREGLVGQYVGKEKPDWQGKRMDLIITTQRLKSGEIKVSFTAPDDEDWTLRKKRTEKILLETKLTVGEYIFQKLLENPSGKIRGKEVHTIDRKFYKSELEKILNKQSQFHEELTNKKLLEKIAIQLYKNNIKHRQNLINKTIQKLIIDDIIFYQRPLKSKKHLLSNCKYESYKFHLNGQLVEKPIKVIAKSHPLFQEYRIWSQIHNIRIFEKEFRAENDLLILNDDVTHEYLNNESKALLFNLFNNRKEINQSQILKYLKLDVKNYKLNYEDEHKFKGNETIHAILTQFKTKEKKAEILERLNDKDFIERIWHILYSLDENEINIKNALCEKSKKENGKKQILNIDIHTAEAISKVKPFAKDYGSLSQKAIEQMLVLMRCGDLWDSKSIHEKTKIRIEKILTGEYDQELKDRVREHAMSFQKIEDFQGLPEWLASYIVYDRHSEVSSNSIFKSPDDIDVNLLVPQHSLRNPVVEKILRETLLIVRDVWSQYGRPNEIHVELARELKMPNDKRKKWTEKRNENHKTNQRAKAMLIELKKDYNSINPYSKGQLDLFKLYEEGVLSSQSEIEDDIKVIRRKGDPTTSELLRYKLWLEQKYISPYTGQAISLADLFSRAIEIEHVIPKSKFYDDSFANKIICEKEANNLKGDMTAYQFISEKGGTKLSNGTQILSKDAYETLVKKMYGKQKSKLRNLLSLEVPKSFNAAQLNNTRYISKKLLQLLDPVVRDEKDKDFISPNLIPMVGGITHKLKTDWGLHQVWKKLLSDRFIRMNEIHKTDLYYQKKNGRIDLSGYDTELKRLDHRHHALDALVVACATRHHIQYINSYQNKKIRYELKAKLFPKSKDGSYQSHYFHPWQSFTNEAHQKLERIIISFKQNLRVINKTNNYYQRYENINGEMVKRFVKQKKSPDFWSIRKPLHKDTVNGKRTVREYKTVQLNKALNDVELIADKYIRNEVKKRFASCEGDIKKVKKSLKTDPILLNEETVVRTEIIIENDNYASSRTLLDESFDQKRIQKIIDVKTKNLVLNHFNAFNKDPKEAFSPNGLSILNRDLKIPLKKVTLIESMGKKFALSETGVKASKYVESAKGTNLFFTIYKSITTGEHLITKDSSIPFGDVYRLMKDQLPLAEDKEGYDCFFLSPGDLVYVVEDGDKNELPSDLDYSRMYKCVSFTKHSCFFVPMSFAISILNKEEFGALNKREKSIDGLMIKNNCVKLSIDRLGNIQ